MTMTLQNKKRPEVSEEQLRLERLELEWMRDNDPSIAEKKVVHRRGGKVFI